MDNNLPDKIMDLYLSHNDIANLISCSEITISEVIYCPKCKKYIDYEITIKKNG